MKSSENTAFKLNESQPAGILLEDEPIENPDSISYPSLLRKIEDEIISLREEREDNDEDYRAKILSRKEEFLEKLTDPNRIHLASVLFGTEELILRDEIANKKGKRIENIIEDVKFQQEMAFFIKNNENNFNLLENYWHLYGNLFKTNGNKTIVKGETLKHGVLAPIALRNILDKKYNKDKSGKRENRMDFTYSTPEDDAMKSIDMIVVDNKNKINMLFQVKGDVMSWEEFEQRVKPKLKSKSNGGINQGGEDNRELIYVINEKDFADKDTSIKDEKLNKFNSGCAAYMKERGKILRENKFKTLGIYIYVPSIIDGQPMIDINGQPHKKLDAFISNFLDLKLAGIAKN